MKTSRTNHKDTENDNGNDATASSINCNGTGIDGDCHDDGDDAAHTKDDSGNSRGTMKQRS